MPDGGEDALLSASSSTSLGNVEPPELNDTPHPSHPAHRNIEYSTSSFLNRALLLLRSDLAVGVLITVFSWPFSLALLSPATAFGGLDYEADLYMAFEARLHYGTQVVFTYGPLGFLAVPSMYYRGPAIVAALASFALFVAIATIIVGSLRRHMNVWVAAAIAYFVTGAAIDFTFENEPELAVGIALVLCLLLISSNGTPRHPYLTWASLGFLASFLSLVKVSTGVAAMCLLLIALVSCARQLSYVLVAIGSAALTLLIGWFGTGNDFGNVLAFVKAAYDEAAGYPSAMQQVGALSHYWLAALAIAVVLASIFASSRKLPLVQQIAAVLAVFVTELFLFKEGFVRQPGHDVTFASVTIVVAAGIGLVWTSKRRPYVLLATLLFLAILTYDFGGVTPFSLSHPITSARNLVGFVTTLGSSTNSARTENEARAAMKSNLSIPVSMLDRIGSSPVSVEPLEDGAVWVLPQLHFDPEPTLQNYNGYTTALDNLDVNWLRGARAPAFILYQANATIDGRDPAFDPPATELAIACNYRQVAATSTWQLLARTSDRCGPPRPLGKVRTGFDVWTKVPTAPAGDAVVASFNLSMPLTWTLENLLFRPHQVTLYTNGGASAYRFITGTAADLHLLIPPSDLNYAEGYAPVPISSLMFSLSGAGTGTPIEIKFYAVHFGRTSRIRYRG